MEPEPERAETHAAVTVPASTMLLTKCIFVGALVRLCGSREAGWLLDSRLCDPPPPSCKPDEPLFSVCSFWSGLSGWPVGLAFILLAPPEWVKPLTEREREREWLLSWHDHASHALRHFISCWLILEFK